MTALKSILKWRLTVNPEKKNESNTFLIINCTPNCIAFKVSIVYLYSFNKQ